MNNPWRADFPILSTEVHGKPLVYLDSGASAQKPACVLEAIQHYYRNDYSNVHRGLHSLSERSTDLFEGVRDQIVAFISAKSRREVVFTSGATESINLVADSFSRLMLKEGDELIVTAMEHHANLVPWQVACERYGATLRIAPLDDEGFIDYEALTALFSDKTRLFAFPHMSNVLGTINDAKALTTLAHEHGVPVLIDGCQAVVHSIIDVQDIDCDFYVFSSHKLYGPTGVGVLYAKESWLERMPPYQFGGDMIDHVTYESSTYADLPHKFEAGTPNIASVVGFGEAMRYLTRIDRIASFAHEDALIKSLHEGLASIDGVRIYGPPADKRVGLIAFSVEAVHAHDVGVMLDRRGIAVRVGHHCAQPLMGQLGVSSTIRASLGLYNNDSDVQALCDSLSAVLALVRGES